MFAFESNLYDNGRHHGLQAPCMFFEFRSAELDTTALHKTQSVSY